MMYTTSGRLVFAGVYGFVTGSSTDAPHRKQMSAFAAISVPHSRHFIRA